MSRLYDEHELLSVWEVALVIVGVICAGVAVCLVVLSKLGIIG